MIATHQALVYRTDVVLPRADKQALAFALSASKLKAVTDAVLKVQQLWPVGARQAKGSATRSKQWKDDQSLRNRAVRTLLLTRIGTKALTPIAD